MTKIIKAESDYTAALVELGSLAALDPFPGTPDAERLELLTLLVQNYEESKSPARLPDPIDAIRFRMEQQELTQRDLVPFIGSPSKVSEVLARKRPLTLSMIRALHRGLEIPAQVLLQDRPLELLDDNDLDWSRFPIREMAKLGWILETGLGVRDRAEDIMRHFFSPLGSRAPVRALYRTASHVRSARTMDKHALIAWTARVLIKARSLPMPKPYRPGIVTPEFMREVAQLSWSGQGPLLAHEYLENHGIPLIVERHLSGTHLDGAVILDSADRPVIGLTLRIDRVDNFWFCLMHELAHIGLHLSSTDQGFYDDLDSGEGNDPREREADDCAGEALIPEDAWKSSPARNLRSPEAAQHLAEKLRIHPAIVAGRIRYTSSNFRVLNHLVGKGEVRKCFPEVQWPGPDLGESGHD